MSGGQIDYRALQLQQRLARSQKVVATGEIDIAMDVAPDTVNSWYWEPGQCIHTQKMVVVGTKLPVKYYSV